MPATSQLISPHSISGPETHAGALPFVGGEDTQFIARLAWLRRFLWRSQVIRICSFTLAVSGWGLMWASALSVLPFPPPWAAAVVMLAGIALIPVSGLPKSALSNGRTGSALDLVGQGAEPVRADDA